MISNHKDTPVITTPQIITLLRRCNPQTAELAADIDDMISALTTQNSPSTDALECAEWIRSAVGFGASAKIVAEHIEQYAKGQQ
jgi:hypothetical protein